VHFLDLHLFSGLGGSSGFVLHLGGSLLILEWTKMSLSFLFLL
jgi:hypothetical protein